MPDRSAPHRLGRLLPARVRQDVFDPAIQDLRVDLLRRAENGSFARVLGLTRYVMAVTTLYVHCWIVTMAGPLDERFDSAGEGPGVLERVFSVTKDLKYAVRGLARQPMFSMAAVLTLSLGVGANVAVFAVVEAVILRPLPYPASDDLIVLRHRDERTGITKEYIAIGDYMDLMARQRSVEILAAYSAGPVAITADGEEPFRGAALQAGPGLMEALRTRASMGRLTASGDSREGAAPVVVLGYERWQTTFGADPDVIGRRVRVGQVDREVVGVAAPGFRFPPAADLDVIVPMPIPAAAPAARKSDWVFALGRLKPGISMERALADFTDISQALEREYPSANEGSRYYAVTLSEELIGSTRTALILLACAVAVVLLIACANVGNLLLARALGRREEIALRVALGAGQNRIVQQLLVESLTLAGVAGAFAILAAHWTVPAVVALVPPTVTAPGLHEAGVNGIVLAFALGLSLVTALLFGALPAIALGGRGSARGLLTPTRVSGGPAARRTASILVMTEVALAAMLLIGAGLVLQTFTRVMAVDPGFDRHDVLAIDVMLPADRYETVESRRLFFDQAGQALSNLPGVTALGAAVVTPLTGNNWTTSFERSDRRLPEGERPPDVGWQVASGGFFDALRIPLRAGRLFDARDQPGGPPVVIVSESIARQYFPGESAVGHRVALGRQDAEIVGVVGDIRRATLTDTPRADMYFPFEQQPGTGITFFIRTTGTVTRGTVEAELRRLEAGILVSGATTLDQVAAGSVAVTTFALWLLGLFAGMALLLAQVGIYGVVSYAVRQRTREIGTRIALGATRGDISWLVVRQGVTIAAGGVTVGLAAGLVAARALSGLLYGISPSDPGTLLGAAAVLLVTALAACYLPARRAGRLDPVRSLTES